jgi:hypothetical protein
MIREFKQWELDYVRKTAETLQDQTVRRKSTAEKNAQRDDIDESMGEGGGHNSALIRVPRVVSFADDLFLI